MQGSVTGRFLAQTLMAACLGCALRQYSIILTEAIRLPGEGVTFCNALASVATPEMHADALQRLASGDCSLHLLIWKPSW